jgi:hypothetical protein
LLERHASQATGLVATIEPVEQESLSQATQAAADVPARESGATSRPRASPVSEGADGQ